ncbi:MAG: hypothetical protein AB7P69_20650 [Candidatus Binatia bacterium]
MRSFDETLELMRIELGQDEGTLLLLGICDDTELRDYTIKELRKRLSPEIGLRDFCYDPEHISLLEAAVATLQTKNGRVALSITGLEDLPRDKWSEAIKLLNLQRNGFGYTGAAVILWVNRATLAEIANKSADFFSWRSGTLIIEPPPGWDTLASARKTYLHAVVAQNEFVNLQGLAPTRGEQIVQMRMEEIFIPLRAEQTIEFVGLRFPLGPEGTEAIEVIRKDANTLILRGKAREQLLSLLAAHERILSRDWEQLPPHKRRAVELYLQHTQQESAPRSVEISDLLQEHRTVVLGDPGAGKTTLLRYLTYVIAKA